MRRLRHIGRIGGASVQLWLLLVHCRIVPYYGAGGAAEMPEKGPRRDACVAACRLGYPAASSTYVAPPFAEEVLRCDTYYK